MHTCVKSLRQHLKTNENEAKRNQSESHCKADV